MFGRAVSRALVTSALLGAASFPALAFAHESGGAQLAKDVPAVTDEGSRAKATVAEVAAASGRDAPLDVRQSLAKARQALSRSHGAHLAGDASGARRLGVVALGWADASKAQLAAASAERRGAEVERAAAELALRRDRASAMLVEAQARRGQVSAQIEQKKRVVEAAKAPPPAKTETQPRPSAAKPVAAPAKPGGGGGGGGKGKGGGGGGGGKGKGKGGGKGGGGGDR